MVMVMAAVLNNCILTPRPRITSYSGGAFSKFFATYIMLLENIEAIVVKFLTGDCCVSLLLHHGCGGALRKANGFPPKISFSQFGNTAAGGDAGGFFQKSYQPDRPPSYLKWVEPPVKKKKTK